MTGKTKGGVDKGWFTISPKAAAVAHKIERHMHAQIMTLCGRFCAEFDINPTKRGAQRCAMCVERLPKG